jgi:hypothetical protein
MNKEYSSRQNKIYSDYKGHSAEKLLEIIKNRNNYLPEVIEIVNDIIAERNDIPGFIKRDIIAKSAKEKEEEDKKEKKDADELFLAERKNRQAEADKFLSKSEHYSDKELSEIITRYLYYEPGAVEAALIISEKRKIISPPEKEKLLSQVEAGFRKKQKQDAVVKKTRKKFSRVEIISGIFLLGLGVILHFTDINISVLGKPVVFYGMIIGGVGLIIDGIF